jgi:hypothetical protein
VTAAQPSNLFLTDYDCNSTRSNRINRRKIPFSFLPDPLGATRAIDVSDDKYLQKCCSFGRVMAVSFSLRNNNGAPFGSRQPIIMYPHRKLLNSNIYSALRHVDYTNKFLLTVATRTAPLPPSIKKFLP